MQKEKLSLNSIFFIGARTAIVCFFLCIALIIEGINISKIEKATTKKTHNQLKNPLFELTPSKRRKMIKNPKKFLSSIKLKEREIKQQLKILSKITKINAFKPLDKIGKDSHALKNIELIKFRNENKQVEAIFKSSNKNDLKLLEHHPQERKL